MANRFDISRIHHRWQPLAWDGHRPLSAEETAYCHFYGIDFAQQLDAVQHDFGYLDSNGFRIACHRWVPLKRCRGTVLVGHGYFGHVGLHVHVIGHLLKQGYAIAAFDLPGHGLSSGEPASIDSFRQYQQVLQDFLQKMQRMPPPWHWVSQSTGSAIAMDFLLHTPEDLQPFDKVFLLAPLVWPRGWQLGKYAHALVSPFTRSVKRHFANNSHDTDFLDFLANHDPLQSSRLSVTWISAWKRWLPYFLGSTPCQHPIQVIQGTNDGTVDWRRNLPVIRQLFPNHQIHTIPTARHQLVNESAELRGDIMRHLDTL